MKHKKATAKLGICDEAKSCAVLILLWIMVVKSKHLGTSVDLLVKFQNMDLCIERQTKEALKYIFP